MSRSQRLNKQPIAPAATIVPSIFHSAASKRLTAARAATSASPSPTPSSPSSAAAGFDSQSLPEDGEFSIVGEQFVVDWSHVYRNGNRLYPPRLSYRVKHKSQLKGGRELAVIWRYGVELSYLEDNGLRKRLWLCKQCHLARSTSDAKAVNGTAFIVEHLKRAHHVDPYTGALPETPVTPYASPFEAAKVAGSNSYGSHNPWQEEALQAALIDWVVIKDVSFGVAVGPGMRGLISWNRTPLLAALPRSPETLRSYIQTSLVERKREVRTLLEASPGRIAISVDVWTSLNHLSFLGVVAHFVDAQYKQRDILIAFRNLYGDHTSAAQGTIVRAVLDDYKISRKFHCFVGDNATSNDGELIKSLNLHPDVNINSSNRIRCAGHIINLVVKATMYGKGVSKWEEQLAQAAPKDQFKLWRDLGVVGKLHNFVNAVCASHKRRELFSHIQKQVNDELLYSFNTLELRQDGGVRWNSVYLMLLRCWELRAHIKAFILHLRTPEYAIDDDLQYNALTDSLSEQEWDDVKELVDFLKAPYDTTKRLEGNNSGNGFGSLWQTLPNLQALWVVYTEAKERPHGEFMTAAINLGFEKLSSYFELLVMDPSISSYAIATALNPSFRLNWFQHHWKNFPPWIRKATHSMKKCFDEYVIKDADADDDELLPLPSRRKLPANSDDLYERATTVDLYLLTGNKNKRQRRAGQLEEYYEALASDVNSTNERECPDRDHPWEWWLAIGRNRYPILFKMAIDYLSCPCTSCDCERAFSSARRTITDDRNGLGCETIEATQLLKNWLRRDVVKSSLRDLEKHVQKLDKSCDSGVATSIPFSVRGCAKVADAW